MSAALVCATVERILDQLCADRPEWGLQHGDVRYAGQLADQSPEAWEQHAEVLADGLRALDDIDDTLTRLGKRGAELVGKVVDYQDTYRLCYIRGPEGVLIGLAQELQRQTSGPA